MTRLKSSCWDNAIKPSLAGCIISLGLISCKTTRQDTAPQSTPRALPKSVVAGSSPHITELAITPLQVGGNTIAQVTITPSQGAYDYVAYEIGGKTTESSTTTFTISDAPVGVNTLKARLCLRDTALAAPCGEYVSQSFTQPKNADPELQKQMTAVETATQEILQQNRDLVSVATDYVDSHPDEKSDLKTVLSNIATIGPDATSNIIDLGGLDVIDEATSGTAGVTVADTTGGDTTGEPTGAGIGDSGSTTAATNSGVTAAVSSGSDASPRANVLLYLGVPAMVLGAAAIVAAGADYRQGATTLDNKPRPEPIPPSVEVPEEKKTEDMRNLEAANEDAIRHLKAAQEELGNFSGNKIDVLKKEQIELERTKKILSDTIKDRNYRFLFITNENNEYQKMLSTLQENILKRTAKIAEIKSLEAIISLGEGKSKLNTEDLSRVIKLRAEIAETEKSLSDIQSGKVPHSLPEQIDLTRVLDGKNTELKNALNPELKKASTIAEKTAMDNANKSLADARKELQEIDSNLKKNHQINLLIQAKKNVSPEVALATVVNELEGKIEYAKEVLLKNREESKSLNKSLKEAEKRLSDLQKQQPQWEDVAGLHDESEVEKKIADLKKEIALRKKTITVLAQKSTKHEGEIFAQVAKPKVDLKAENIQKIKTRTKVAAVSGAASMVAGIILTATSQTAMGLVGKSAISDKAFTLWLLDGIEVNMRKAIADRAMAEYKILTILNK